MRQVVENIMDVSARRRRPEKIVVMPFRRLELLDVHRRAGVILEPLKTAVDGETNRAERRRETKK